jgi:hypothetical protein
MGRARQLPDEATLRRWFLDEKLTYQQMADRWAVAPGGASVTRAAFQNDIANYDWFVPRYKKHAGTDLSPWDDIRPEHIDKWDIAMLRRESFRRQGGKLDPDAEADLNRWLQSARDGNWVIAYRRDTKRGFWRVPRRATDPDLVRLPPKYRAQMRRQRRLRAVG